MRSFPRMVSLGGGLPEVCRLGLATRGNTRLDPTDVRRAIDAGVNYLNWCAHPDGLSRAVREMGSADRQRVVVAMQFMARTQPEAERELAAARKALGTDRIDVVTFYYVERPDEWEQIRGPGGALSALVAARNNGMVRLIGMTTHQRTFAARVARSGLLDLLMIRYNAAHRGAEQDVFPVTRAIGMPVVAYTCLRWKALLKPTRGMPNDFVLPSAAECYRFVLEHPDVAVALMAPDGSSELAENLKILEAWAPLSRERRGALCAHGDRVHEEKRAFP